MVKLYKLMIKIQIIYKRKQISPPLTGEPASLNYLQEKKINLLTH